MERRGYRLSRRAFMLGTGSVGLGLLAGCGCLPWQAPSPTVGKIHRLGYLHGGNPAGGAPALDIFRQALGELGYVEGQNLVIESRWGDGNVARLVEPAAELTRLPVDVLVVPAMQVARIAHEATTTVPIVLAGSGDLVAAGLAVSYARPGGNVTGVTTLSEQLTGKRLQLLKEAVPSIARVAVLWDAATIGPFPTEARGHDAHTVGVQLHPLELHGIEEFAAAFEAAAHEGADALLVQAGPLGSMHRAQIIQLTARLGGPAIYDQRQYVEDGGLMAYAASPTDLWRRAAVYVDKILKGATPTVLPIEQPMRFDFVVNLKTAQALGITFPNEIMLQVTELIQ